MVHTTACCGRVDGRFNVISTKLHKYNTYSVPSLVHHFINVAVLTLAPSLVPNPPAVSKSSHPYPCVTSTFFLAHQARCCVFPRRSCPDPAMLHYFGAWHAISPPQKVSYSKLVQLVVALPSV